MEVYLSFYSDKIDLWRKN